MPRARGLGGRQAGILLRVCAGVVLKAAMTSVLMETEHFLALPQQERAVLNNYLTGDEKVRYPIMY